MVRQYGDQGRIKNCDKGKDIAEMADAYGAHLLANQTGVDLTTALVEEF